jgi:hypothetical protein
MSPLNFIEADPLRPLEFDIDEEAGRIHVTGLSPDEPTVPEVTAITPAVCPRCGTQQRELLGQHFCDAPLHRRAR